MFYEVSVIDSLAACSRAVSAAIDWYISPQIRRRTSLVKLMARAAKRRIP